jgi:hypothetical protein
MNDKNWLGKKEKKGTKSFNEYLFVVAYITRLLSALLWNTFLVM